MVEKHFLFFAFKKGFTDCLVCKRENSETLANEHLPTVTYLQYIKKILFGIFVALNVLILYYSLKNIVHVLIYGS